MSGACRATGSSWSDASAVGGNRRPAQLPEQWAVAGQSARLHVEAPPEQNATPHAHTTPRTAFWSTSTICGLAAGSRSSGSSHKMRPAGPAVDREGQA